LAPSPSSRSSPQKQKKAHFLATFYNNKNGFDVCMGKNKKGGKGIGKN